MLRPSKVGSTKVPPPRIWRKGTFLFLFLQIFLKLISLAYYNDAVCNYHSDSVYRQISGY